MISVEDVKKLADLARIEVGENEAKTLAKDIEEIVGYVQQIQHLSVEEVENIAVMHERVLAEPHNVFREDGTPHIAGEYTDVLISAAPEKKDGFVKVQKIL